MQKVRGPFLWLTLYKTHCFVCCNSTKCTCDLIWFRDMINGAQIPQLEVHFALQKLKIWTTEQKFWLEKSSPITQLSKWVSVCPSWQHRRWRKAAVVKLGSTTIKLSPKISGNSWLATPLWHVKVTRLLTTIAPKFTGKNKTYQLDTLLISTGNMIGEL